MHSFTQSLMEWLQVPPEEMARRGLRAGFILGITVLVAWIVARVGARWGRHVGHASSREAGEELAARISRGVMLIAFLGGTYFAIEALEIDPRWLRVAAAIAYVTGTFIAVRLCIRIASALARSYFDRRARDAAQERVEREYLPLTNTLATIAITLVGFIAVAHHFGHDVASLIAALGVGSLAIGLAAQQTLGNMIAGFTLLVDRPFRPGDRIKIASGETGEVMEIGLRSTRILMPDRHLLVVPNTELVNSRVVNFDQPTAHGRGEVRVKLPLKTDVAAWSERMMKLAAAEPGVEATPAPTVRLVALDESKLELVLQFQVADQTQVAALEDRVRRQLLDELASAWAPPPT